MTRAFGDGPDAAEHLDAVEATLQPKKGGAVLSAVVEHAGDSYVQARHLARSVLWVFHQGSGWGATPELSCWRLRSVSLPLDSTEDGP